MDLLNFNSYLKSLNPIEFIPFFIDYLNKHHYINALNLSRDYLRERIKLSHYHPYFNNLSRTLRFKFNPLIQVGIRLKILTIFNTNSLKVSNKEKLNLEMISDSLKKTRISNNMKTEKNSKSNLYLRLNTTEKEKLDSIAKKEKKSITLTLRTLINDFLNQMDLDKQKETLRLMKSDNSKKTEILNHNFSIRIHKEIKENFKEIAKQNEINQSSILRGLVDNFINQYENEEEKAIFNEININLPNKNLNYQ